MHDQVLQVDGRLAGECNQSGQRARHSAGHRAEGALSEQLGPGNVAPFRSRPAHSPMLGLKINSPAIHATHKNSSDPPATSPATAVAMPPPPRRARRIARKPTSVEVAVPSWKAENTN